MKIREQLASVQGRRDEVPNQVLAKSIAEQVDHQAVQDLVLLLADKDQGVQNDSIKVLYEIGGIRPDMIAAHLQVFMDLLVHKNNRLCWGGMTAIHCIARSDPQAVYVHLEKIMAASDSGSVITRDQAVNILIELAGSPGLHDEMLILLMEQLQAAPGNQLPMYAERALPLISRGFTEIAISTLQDRLQDLEKASKQKRVEKVIAALIKKRDA